MYVYVWLCEWISLQRLGIHFTHVHGGQSLAEYVCVYVCVCVDKSTATRYSLHTCAWWVHVSFSRQTTCWTAWLQRTTATLWVYDMSLTCYTPSFCLWVIFSWWYHDHDAAAAAAETVWFDLIQYDMIKPNILHMPKAEASQLKSLHQMKNLKEQKNKGKSSSNLAQSFKDSGVIEPFCQESCSECRMDE